jgi:hypothetical protein
MAGKEDIVKVITSRTVDEKIASLVQEKREFPDPSSIELSEPFVDVFKPPSWCDTQQNSYAWVDPNDEVQLDRALNYNYWVIVTRSNHPRARTSDFRTHGAVERRGMILVYRPQDLDLRLRYLSEKRHTDMMEAQKEGAKGDKWERSMVVGENVPAPGFKPYYGEPAGKEGIVSMETTED